MTEEKKFKCILEFFRWGSKTKPLSWVRITSPTGNQILINISFQRQVPLPKKDIAFLEILAKGKEWPKKNEKMYTNSILQRFLDISRGVN